MTGDERVTHARFEPRRGGVRSRWWGKAWQAAVEESAYSEADLLLGRKHARAGRVGRIAQHPGGYVAAVEVGDDVFTVSGTVAVLEEEAQGALVEVVASRAGRIGALLAGDLPNDLAEECEELGVELVPWAGELGFTCSCEPWADPCPHALAVATQVGWLLDADPFVLTGLRGLGRDRLLGALTTRVTRGGPQGADPDPGVEGVEELDDLTIAEEAALRASRVLLGLD